MVKCQITNMNLPKASLLLVGILLLLAVFATHLPSQGVDVYPAPMLFSLNDPRTQYVLVKDDSGTYSLKYHKTGANRVSGEVSDQSALIGSSKVTALDIYLDKPIRVKGHFRWILGQPLCWKPCTPQVGHDGKHEVLVDIDAIDLE